MLTSIPVSCIWQLHHSQYRLQKLSHSKYNSNWSFKNLDQWSSTFFVQSPRSSCGLVWSWLVVKNSFGFLPKNIYYSIFSETLCKMFVINAILDRRPRSHVDKIGGMRDWKYVFLRYHWKYMNCVASSGEIQIFEEQALPLQDSLTTGSLIITVSRDKPCWLSQYKCKVDLCVANWYSLAREIIDFSYFS